MTADLTIAAAEALVGRPRPERPRGLPGQLDLLGGPEVTAPAVIANHAPEVSERERLNHLIVGLEYALAVIRAAERTTLRGPNGRIAIGIAKEWIKQRARLAAAASTVTTALAFLKDLRRAPR